MARELSIVYGSITMGEAPYIVNGQYTSNHTNETGEYVWEVVVTSDTASSFASRCKALEEEFEKRFKTFTMSWGGSSHRSAIHTSDTGFNHVAGCEKVADIGSTGRTRVYRCSVGFELPASDNNGRRSSSVTVSEDESRIRTLTVTGVYTAQGGTGARENAKAKLSGYVSAIRTAIGGTWDKEIVAITSDDQDKNADFNWQQREIVYAEADGGLDTAKIIRANIDYRRRGSWPGDSPGVGVTRRQLVDMTFSCGIDKDEDTDLNAVYENTVRPYILSEARSIFGTSQVAIVDESPGIESSANRIRASLTLDVVIGGGASYSYSAEQRVEGSPNFLFVPIWDGEEWTKHKYETKATGVRTTTVVEIRDGADGLSSVAGLSTVSGSGSSQAPKLPGGSNGWHLVNFSEHRQPVTVGDPDQGEQISYTVITTAVVEEYAKEPVQGSSSAPVTDNPGNGGDGGGGAATTDPVTITDSGGASSGVTHSGGADGRDFGAGGGVRDTPLTGPGWHGPSV